MALLHCSKTTSYVPPMELSTEEEARINTILEQPWTTEDDKKGRFIAKFLYSEKNEAYPYIRALGKAEYKTTLTQFEVWWLLKAFR